MTNQDKNNMTNNNNSSEILDGKNPHCGINGENKFKRIFIRHKKK